MIEKKTILIVDDEPNILLAVEFLLQKAGHKVLKANNAEQALSLANQHFPKVMVLDVMMPGMNGFELARQLRQNSRHQDARIIFLTAKGAQADRFKGYDSGGEVYLTKPFDNDELVMTINEVLEFG